MCLVLIGGLVWWARFRAPKAEIANVGGVVLHDLSVQVTGATYRLGELEPGARISQRLDPSGTSHLEVDWRTPDGQAHHRVIDCYFSSGWPEWTGTLRVDIAAAEIQRVDGHFDIGP